ncbi:hypothetical protein PHMEG_00017015 [Phytophthora megakarya]|uniref:Peptidase A2 domain-containing protein n=1 Tax=Phytophthora megakarya TaxID=4795 RepID=A0A225VXK2_9STRA|nr:hypothetical protein PHMEG_00017015 [Phytophthora megakarya]
MRTLVERAVNGQGTRILLDTGTNVSIVSARYAKKLGLRDTPDQDCSMYVQGISKDKATATRRTTVKITLGWERVYVFDMWVINHCAGVDALLRTEFMIPEGVLLDMFHSDAKLPDEVLISLIKTQAMRNEPEIHYEDSGAITMMNIPNGSGSVSTFRRDIRRQRLTKFGLGGRNPFPSSNIGMCSARTSPTRYRILDSVPVYTEWQVLVYAEARDDDLYKNNS